MKTQITPGLYPCNHLKGRLITLNEMDPSLIKTLRQNRTAKTLSKLEYLAKEGNVAIGLGYADRGRRLEVMIPSTNAKAVTKKIDDIWVPFNGILRQAKRLMKKLGTLPDPQTIIKRFI